MANKRFDLLAIGECLVEFRKTGDGLLSQSFAGDTFNSLFYASRLGLKTSYLSAIGNDEYSSELVRFMDDEDIGRNNLLHRTTRRNGAYLIETDAKKNSHLTFWRKDSAATTLLQSYSATRLQKRLTNTRYFLFSMIALGMLRKGERLIEALTTLPSDVTTIFDLNYRASLWKNRDEYLQTISLVKHADYVMHSSSDGEIKPQLLEQLTPKAIIKRNADAPTVVAESSSICEIPTHKCSKFVDATGAGDAFNAGFIFGLRKDLGVRDSVVLGNICGSMATERAGGINNDFSVQRVLRMFNAK